MLKRTVAKPGNNGSLSPARNPPALPEDSKSLTVPGIWEMGKSSELFAEISCVYKNATTTG